MVERKPTTIIRVQSSKTSTDHPAPSELLFDRLINQTSWIFVLFSQNAVMNEICIFAFGVKISMTVVSCSTHNLGKLVSS